MNPHNSLNSNKKNMRKYDILGHIVYSYISTAVPVSSKIVAARMEGNISSATIRNIMAELEEEGYIEQPHTSAGRVPTNLGYRQYVDMVKSRIQFKKQEAERLAGEYNRKIDTIKKVITKTSFLISRELHNAGIVLRPGIENFNLKHLELVKVKAKTVLAILVMMSNDVRNYILEIDRDLQKAELSRVTNYINTNYSRLVLSHVLDELRKTVQNADTYEEDIMKIAGDALSVFDSVVKEDAETELYWEGLNYFMDETDLRNINVTRNLYQIFSEGDDLVRLMQDELPYRGIKVYIGKENKCEMLKECSVITCGYTLQDRTIGRIGVIGPTRMDYGHALRTVSCLAELVSSKLEEIN